jgi:hypothetical protein
VPHEAIDPVRRVVCRNLRRCRRLHGLGGRDAEGRSRGRAAGPAAPAVVPAAAADAADPLAGRLRPLLHRLDATGAVVAARVIELPSGRELYADRADEAVIPASNMKLPVSAAALDRFGPDHEVKTYLAVDGDDLWLIGTGDPATGDPALAKKRNEKPTAMLDRWAAALKARGVTAVKGNLYYYDGAFEDVGVHPTWSRSYLTDWYAAPVAGLNFNDNCVDVTVRPAKADGTAAKADATQARRRGCPVGGSAPSTAPATGPATAPAGPPAAFEVMPPTASVEIVNQTVTTAAATPRSTAPATRTCSRSRAACGPRRAWRARRS